MRNRTAAALLFLGSASSVLAQVPAGGEFQVNIYTTGDQTAPSFATDASGAFVVAWESAGQDGSGFGVFARRYAADGTPRGSEFQVNTFTAGDQRTPAVASSAAGGFVVVWSSAGADGDGSGIVAQLHDASGARRGSEFQVNAATTGPQVRPSVAANTVGNFVVTWGGPDAHLTGIFAQRFAASGMPLGAEFQVNTYTPNQQGDSVVSSDAYGNFVVVWTSQYQDGSGDGVFGQRFDASGERRGSEFQVDTYTSHHQFLPEVASDAAGNFVVVWQRWQYVGGPPGPVTAFRVLARRFSNSGVPQGPEFQVDTLGLFAYPASPAVAIDWAGNFIVSWQSQTDGSRNGVYTQRYDATGARRGSELRINTYTLDTQWMPAVVSDAAGNLVVAWESCQSPFFPPGQDGDRCGVFAQRVGGIVPSAMAVDTAASGGSDGNGVLEPAESVDVRPSWRNVNGAAQTFDGTVLAFTGPPAAGVTYQLLDGTGAYGTVANGATAPCSECYQVALGFAGTRPDVHWDATLTERLVPDALGQTMPWPVHVGQSFTDVPKASPFYRFAETLLHEGVTAGCGNGVYCPGAPTTREQMAAFVLPAREGPGYAPVPCSPPNLFGDVPETSPFCDVIEELARRGVVSGCGGGNYCPASAVTREQMAVFVLRTLDPALSPPPCTTPIFADVPASSTFCRWIEDLARRGVVTGCGGGNYCPLAPVTREQMAVFLSVTFGLSLYGP